MKKKPKHLAMPTPLPRLPFKSIRVGYQEVRIKDVNTSNGEFGRYHGGNGIMQLDMNKHDHGERELANTVLHEVLHAIFRQQGLREIKILDDHEELMVTGLANGLTQVFLDNPTFHKWLGEAIANS